MKKITLFLICICASFALFAKTVPTVTVSIAPEQYFVQMIAKNSVKVNVLVPNNIEAEYYSPTPQQLVNLRNSDIYFQIGLLPFENTINSKIKNIAPNTQVVNLSQGLNLAQNADPHIWLSVSNAQVMSQSIYQALCNKYPQNRAFYTKNYLKLQANNEKLGKEISYILRNYEGKSFITYHPAFSYYATEFGINEVSIETNGKQPSPQQMANTIQFAKQNKIRTIFIQSQLSDKAALTIAKQIHAQVIVLNPMEANWAHNMLTIATKLSGSFQVAP